MVEIKKVCVRCGSPVEEDGMIFECENGHRGTIAKRPFNQDTNEEEEDCQFRVGDRSSSAYICKTHNSGADIGDDVCKKMQRNN